MVAVSFFDNSLVQHLGFPKSFYNKRFQMTCPIEALNMKEAIEKAKDKFWNDSTVMPFRSSKVSLKSDFLIIDENKIVVQKIE